MAACALLRVPEDVLCSLAIPDCRVLLMARTCKRMHAALTAKRAPVHVTVRQKVLTDARLAKEFTSGMYRIQALFRITRFECLGFLNATRCRCLVRVSKHGPACTPCNPCTRRSARRCARFRRP